jgi:hypothetical protein
MISQGFGSETDRLRVGEKEEIPAGVIPAGMDWTDEP